MMKNVVLNLSVTRSHTPAVVCDLSQTVNKHPRSKPTMN